MDGRTNERLYQLFFICIGWTIIVRHYHDAFYSIPFKRACLHACTARSSGFEQGFGSIWTGLGKKKAGFLFFFGMLRAYFFNDYNNGGMGGRKIVVLYFLRCNDECTAGLFYLFIIPHYLATLSFLSWYMQRRISILFIVR